MLVFELSVNVVPCCSDPVASGSVAIVAPCSAVVTVGGSCVAAVVAVDGSCVAAIVVVVAAVVVDVDVEHVSSADSIPVQKAYLPDATVALKDKNYS